jgi:DNA-3-methyladenine glycosylase
MAFPRDFFDRPVDRVAKDLIGATFLVDGAGGIIVETESYDSEDPASHSFGMRKSVRNGSMFGPPGIIYVYRIYGMYWCLNFVCRPGSAVLIRAMEPQSGLAIMKRRRKTSAEKLLLSGPGKLCQALGITNELDGASLYRAPFKLIAAPKRARLHTGTRIGITKGADLHRRFGLYGSPFVSKRFADPDV